MPVDRPLLVDASGKLLIDSIGQLADPACCCGTCPPSSAPSVIYLADVSGGGDTSATLVNWVAWDTDIDGDDWGNGDVGQWCLSYCYGATGQFCCSPTEYFEITEIRFGTVNGDTGWHVVTYGSIDPPADILYDYLNTFLGAAPVGTITRVQGGYSRTWDISYS